MARLSDTQAIILSGAAQHPDGLAAPPDHLPPAPRGAVAKTLLKAGLLEVLDSTERQHTGLAWRLDGAALFLRVTAARLQAIGVEAKGAAQDASTAAATAPDAAEGRATPDATDAAQEPRTGTQDGPPV